MTARLRLLCVLAHPDDESQGLGGILAKYSAEGVETHVVTATRGERGWAGIPPADPGPRALGEIREAELRAAADVLGVSTLTFLDYVDGDLDQAEPAEAIAKIVGHLRRVRPQVVVTFDPGGAYGHPDHIAICQFTTAACIAATDPEYAGASGSPHTVLKLYYMADTRRLIAMFESLVGLMRFPVDGVERMPMVWEDWAITARVDCSAYWQTAWRAIACHTSQLPTLPGIEQWSEQEHRRMWANQTYYRAFSLVNGGRNIEKDLFEGIE
jgi:LmbE family N-acetylglucosaminyl deacetylase